MKGLQHLIANADDTQTIARSIQAGLKEQLVSGLSGSARTLFIASLYKETKKTIVVITHNLLQAQKLFDDLASLVSEEKVFIYSVNELISSEIAIASPEMRAQRIEVLNELSTSFSGIVIVPMAGARRLIPPKNVWLKSMQTFAVGEEIDLDERLNQLVASGYKREDMVTSPGEFSVRGGIIDIYPLTEERPVRIELFDTEVDSIRYFEVEDQRSLDKIESITFGPASEVILFSKHYQNGARKLEEGLKETLKKVKSEAVKTKLAENLQYEINQLKSEANFQGMYKYVSLYYDEAATILDYVSSDAIIIVDEISRVREMAESLDKEEAEWLTALLGQGEAIVDLKISKTFESLLKQLEQPVVYLSLFLKHIPHTNPQNIVNIHCKPVQNFHGQLHLLKSEVERWLKNDYTVIFLAPNKERAKRLQHVFEDYEMKAEIYEGDIRFKEAQILIGSLNEGFELALYKLVVITEEEIFAQKKMRRKPRRQKLSNAERIKNYTELKVGDYVVHTHHGIGKYLGIETLEINGTHKDYLLLRYAGNDKLFVPVDQIDLVQKYVGSEEKEPKLSTLGGSEWKRTKKKVKSSVEDIADELIQLYAAREASVGHAFSKDTEMQREFEATFPYQETEDQLRAIAEIKADMEKPRPMDRLLCGDVGYGKTEVAIRAAFKAIMDGKQVAFLVPTTILAQQHYETIRERMADFPVNISVLSRFRSQKEQKETLKGLRTGTIDLVIGTHRLLSKDVQFKDLGLLIVDEEQRFGVMHKEKIKQMKTNIDVLTLTATPIPRTLHMSMLGVRDLSVIETPPENRFPVQTYVVEYNASLVKEAIERELARGGQVYFLYNRIEGIARMAEQIAELVPDARVTFAHGKMNERELEAIMLDFLEGNYDVLVTTTIIETGVDIPNVNTLIVYDADKLGLSQLYQIRGRVGRSNRIAYAYFTYQRDKVLTEDAEKRLQAIKEFTELGSGFKIAMRDLAIRGAGNLLGAQQHGFIESVGFDLYSQMLKEAIEERKGIKPKEPPFETEINLHVDAYIPSAYIADVKQKFEMYKRFRAVEELADVDDIADELVDRFGDYPEEVACLLAIARIKVLAQKEKVERIEQEKNRCVILFSESLSNQTDGMKLFYAVHELGKDILPGTEGKKIKIAFPVKNRTTKEMLSLCEQLLKAIANAKKELTNNG